MEEQEQGGPDPASAPTQSTRDGTMDFSAYSLEQLTQLHQILDRRAYPQNFAHLSAELERRQSSLGPRPESQPAASMFHGRFTSHGGLLGVSVVYRPS